MSSDSHAAISLAVNKALQLADTLNAERSRFEAEKREKEKEIERLNAQVQLEREQKEQARVRLEMEALNASKRKQDRPPSSTSDDTTISGSFKASSLPSKKSRPLLTANSTDSDDALSDRAPVKIQLKRSVRLKLIHIFCSLTFIAYCRIYPGLSQQKLRYAATKSSRLNAHML